MKSPNTLPERRKPLLFPRLAIVLTTAFLVAAAGCSVPPEPNTANASKEPSEAAVSGTDQNKPEIKLSRVSRKRSRPAAWAGRVAIRRRSPMHSYRVGAIKGKTPRPHP